MDISKLIERAQQGNESAWVTLVQQEQEAVFRLAYLLLRDADDAADVAQDAFIRAFRALPSFDAARPLRPWLLQITQNLARNRRRSLRRYLAMLQRWWQTIPPAEEPIDLALHRQEAQTLWQAVQKLPPSDQEVIYLRYFLELSVAESAATLGIAEGTIKSRLSRALARLRVVAEGQFPALHKEGEV